MYCKFDVLHPLRNILFPTVFQKSGSDALSVKNGGCVNPVCLTRGGKCSWTYQFKGILLLLFINLSFLAALVNIKFVSWSHSHSRIVSMLEPIPAVNPTRGGTHLGQVHHKDRHSLTFMLTANNQTDHIHVVTVDLLHFRQQ